MAAHELFEALEGLRGVAAVAATGAIGESRLVSGIEVVRAP